VRTFGSSLGHPEQLRASIRFNFIRPLAHLAVNRIQFFISHFFSMRDLGEELELPPGIPLRHSRQPPSPVSLAPTPATTLPTVPPGTSTSPLTVRRPGRHLNQPLPSSRLAVHRLPSPLQCPAAPTRSSTGASALMRAESGELRKLAAAMIFSQTRRRRGLLPTAGERGVGGRLDGLWAGEHGGGCSSEGVYLGAVSEDAGGPTHL
jgi:hypothetical protein